MDDRDYEAMNKHNYGNDFIADVSNCKRLDSKDKRFNAMWDWGGFAIGFQVSKPHKCTGWNWYVSLDFTFLSLWWYF